MDTGCWGEIFFPSFWYNVSVALLLAAGFLCFDLLIPLILAPMWFKLYFDYWWTDNTEKFWRHRNKYFELPISQSISFLSLIKWVIFKLHREFYYKINLNLGQVLQLFFTRKKTHNNFFNFYFRLKINFIKHSASYSFLPIKSIFIFF